MTDIKTLMPGYEVYKDSGVEWIGEIPAHWKLLKIKNIGKLFNGATPQSSVNGYWNGDIIWATPSDINGVIWLKKTERSITLQGYRSCGTSIVPKGSLIVTTRAPIGKIAISDIPLCTNQGCKSIVVFNNNSSLFLYFLLSISSGFLNSLGTGTTFMELSFSKLSNFIITHPPIAEQTAISNFLDCKTTKIDQTVAIKEKQIRLLKERKQLLIQNAVTKGLDPDVPMRDSGVEWIGDIPHHWDIVTNRTLFKERVEPGKDGLPLLSVSIHSGISDDEVSEEDNIRGRVKIEDKTKYNLVEPNDIVFNMMRAWQGAIGSSRVKGMVSPAYIIAEPKGEIFSHYFEYQYRCPIFIAQMDRFSKGITDFRKRLYWHEFKQLLTVRPPIDEQKAIVSHIQAQSGKIDKAVAIQEQMIEKLKEYKATLINSAVTGKIKVPQIGEAKAVV